MAKKPSDKDSHASRAAVPKNLSVKITESLDRELTWAANSKGLSKSEIVREAVTEYVAQEPAAHSRSFLAQAEDHVGCVEGPEDLSTNASHMEDYGQ